MRRVVQILPRVPPALCGVGDQSWTLAKQLRRGHNIGSDFLFCDPNCPEEAVEEGLTVKRVTKGNASALADEVLARGDTISAVVIQVSGYGFDRNGAPFWLAKALETIRYRRPELRIVAMFHELFANGPITSRAFWTRLPQQWALRRIARCTDVLHTNRSAYGDWLAKAVGRARADVRVLPVFSNFGESASPVPPSQRSSMMMLMQPPALGSPTGNKFWQQWHQVVDVVQPQRVVVAGRAGQIPDDGRIERLGIVSPSEASGLLAQARHVMLDYYDGYLGKSSLFAAVAAHGASCVLAKPNASEADGLIEGIHFTTACCLADGAEREDAIARQLWCWYQGHSIAATATSFAEGILKS